MKQHRLTSFQAEGWRGQLARLERWHARLVELRQHGQEDRDFIYAFCQTAYHLRDWMLNDGAATRSELDDLMRSSLALRICRDLCNGSKHLVIQPGRASVDEHASLIREYVPGPIGHPEGASSRTVVLANGPHDLWIVIDECLSVWETFARPRL